MRYILIFTTIFFLFISKINGQLNSSFVEFLEETMTYLEEEVDPVGLSVSVRSGDDVWSHAIGISSMTDSLKTTSILAMGSITKTFTSAGILKLREENKLSFDDPIHKYLPRIDHVDSTITIKELLNHTSGIHDYTFNPIYFPTLGLETAQFYNYSPEEVLEQFLLEKVFDRGTRQEYSNTNYLLLGMIITEIADRPFYEEIFDMFDISENYPSVSYPPFNFDISELANLWADFGNGFENIQEAGIGLNGLFSSVSSTGAFVGTADDLSKWGYDLYSGKLLSESSMEALFDYPPFLFDGLREYGLGVINLDIECGVNAVGHDGAIFYGADLAYSEELDLSVAVMINGDRENSFSKIGSFLVIKEEILCGYAELLMTSTEEVVEDEEVVIYPNPVNDIVHIQLPQSLDFPLQIDVYNQTGSLVHRQETPIVHQQSVDLNCFSEFSNGFYYIKISDNKKAFTKKLVKI